MGERTLDRFFGNIKHLANGTFSFLWGYIEAKFSHLEDDTMMRVVLNDAGEITDIQVADLAQKPVGAQNVVTLSLGELRQIAEAAKDLEFKPELQSAEPA